MREATSVWVRPASRRSCLSLAPTSFGRHRNQPTSLRRPCCKFSHRLQTYQARPRPNFSLHSPLFGLSETPLRHWSHSSPSSSPSCSVRCSPRRSDRCGLSRSPHCGPGCCLGCGASRCPRCSLHRSTRCWPGRSCHCGLSRRPRCSPRSSDRGSPDCPVNCLPSCSPSCSIHCCPDCGDSNVPDQTYRDNTRPLNPCRTK